MPPLHPHAISDFTFPDRTGTPVAFDDVDARIRVINFWASWSPYSKTELPALAEIKKTYGEEVDVVALNRDANPEEGKVFFDSLEVGDELIELYDQGDELYREVGGYAMPETIFVDRKGRVLTHVHGPMGYDEMKATLERLLQ